MSSIRKLKRFLYDTGLFTSGMTSLYTSVRNLGFQNKKFNSRKVLIGKPFIGGLEILIFLKSVGTKNTGFLDEIWLNKNIRRHYTDGTVCHPSGQGEKLNYPSHGSHSGWINAPPLVIQVKKYRRLS